MIGNIEELMGWLAAALTLCSFIFSNQKWLRIVNLAGCFCWIVFGCLLQQMNYQVIFVNATIAIIHILWLIKNRSLKNIGKS